MSNFNFNKVIVGGRIASDIELRQTLSGVSVASFRLAVSRKQSQADSFTDFFTVTAWRGTAEMIAAHLKKGSAVCIVGKIINNSYEDKDGNRRLVTEINAEEVTFVDSKADAARITDVSPSNAAPDSTAEKTSADGDLPF